MISVDEALAILVRESGPLETEPVGLDGALGRALAETVTADRDYPPTDRSAMDGVAVDSADLPEPGRTLALRGEVRAGQTPAEIRVGDGVACHIFTGAVVPPGADTVVMVERTREDREAGTVTIEIRPRPGDHIRPRGQDLQKGAAVLEKGAAIRPAEIAALTSVGRIRPMVYRRPAVHVLATGDEIVEPDRVPLDHQIRNSNSGTLLAQLHGMNLEGRYLGIASDDRADLDLLLGEGLSGDLLLISGGVSVGKYDHVREVLERRGMRVLFHKVAVKPGKPILAGRCGRCLVLGLPGNPVSTFVGFALFAAPVLRRMLGYRNWENVTLTARLEQPLRVKPGRLTYHLASIGRSAGRLTARPVPSTGSGDVLSVARANGFLITDASATAAPAGSEWPALLWGEVDLR